MSRQSPRGPSVLIVDDDEDFARSAAEFARTCGFEPAVAHSVAQSRRLLDLASYDLLMLDLVLPDGTGLELADSANKGQHGEIVILTGSPGFESAQQAVSLPISHYFTKPLAPKRFTALLEEVRQQRRMGDVVPGSSSIVGSSSTLQKSLRELRQVAPTDVSVLLTGESGTGKELFARALHADSRREGAFVAVNCGAVAPELLASQLFGHERGAFTGASARHLGFFEQAHGGTLFLDEITEMPLPLQVFLLRVLESRKVTRLGGHGAIPVDVRVVSATNRPPMEAVDEGALRLDLFYRLCEFEIALPPLRERGDDVLVLARMFVEQLNRRYGARKALAPGAEHILRQHPWPGNIRELRNTVQRGYLLAAGSTIEVEVEPVEPVGLSGHEVGFRVGMSFAEVERQMLLRTLAHYNNDKTRTARALGVSVRTVHNHLAREAAREPGHHAAHRPG